MEKPKMTATDLCKEALLHLFDDRENLFDAWEVWDAIGRLHPDDSPPMLETIQAFGRKHSGEKLAYCVRFTYHRGTFTIERTET